VLQNIIYVGMFAALRQAIGVAKQGVPFATCGHGRKMLICRKGRTAVTLHEMAQNPLLQQA
jgi:hypothetical protein